MTHERCINLTPAEAIAFRDGATCLIRPAQEFGPHDIMPATAIMSLRGDGHGCDWSVGDILILREAWHACPHHDDTFYRTDNEQNLPLSRKCVAHGGWRPANKMPKALARHRYPVVSVRVCRAGDVSNSEIALAGSTHDVITLCRGCAADESWVSVTTLERSL